MFPQPHLCRNKHQNNDQYKWCCFQVEKMNNEDSIQLFLGEKITLMSVAITHIPEVFEQADDVIAD